MCIEYGTIGFLDRFVWLQIEDHRVQTSFLPQMMSFEDFGTEFVSFERISQSLLTCLFKLFTFDWFNRFIEYWLLQPKLFDKQELSTKELKECPSTQQ